MKISRQVLDEMPLILFSIDKRGLITISEGKELKKLGLKHGQVVGKSVFELYGETPRVTDNIKRALSGETFLDEVDMGGVVLEVGFFPLANPAGEVYGLFGVARDVSYKRKKRTARRKKAAAKAKSKKRA